MYLKLRALLAFLLLCAGCRPDPHPATVAASLQPATQDSSALRALRAAMVREQIEARDISDPAVLRALRTVPRHRFVSPELAEVAYTDQPLPIGFGQTISQPYIVAYMAAAARLQPGDRVLEIGTGSGYGAAVLAELAAEVYTMEILPELARQAAAVLDTLGYDQVHVLAGNGWLGWPEHAPYDAIVVTAAPDEIPAALVDQLAMGGRLVIPVGRLMQHLRVLEKSEQGLRELERIPVRFVPMVRERLE